MYKQSSVLPVEERGFSSVSGTKYLVNQLPNLFKKYAITSIFDAGANDCAWQALTLDKMIRYFAGEHNALMVDIAKKDNPNINVIVHDIRHDPLPNVDLLFVRDVTIHLNNYNKQLMIDNWLRSDIPWLLMTQINTQAPNEDFDHADNQFPFAEINWKLPPWNFPEPIDFVVDLWPGSNRYMALWHKDQL